MEVVGIAGDDHATPRARRDHHGCIDDVARSGCSAQLAASACSKIVERLDLDLWRSQEPGKYDLSGAMAPHLSDDTGGYTKRIPSSDTLFQQRDHLPVTPLECDERPRIKC